MVGSSGEVHQKKKKIEVMISVLQVGIIHRDASGSKTSYTLF